MLLLAFDTATPAVTVAVHDGDRVLAESTAVDARRHGELLAPGIADVLRTAGASRRDVTGVVVGVGPGPFTGLRVGVVTARALGEALGVRVHGVCTLDALAYDARVEGPVLVATDARRREVYWAAYDGPRRRVAGPAVDRPADVPVHGRTAVGAGAVLYPDVLGSPHPPEHPAAGTLARMVVEGYPTAEPLPLYLRRPDAAVPGTPKAVLPA